MKPPADLCVVCKGTKKLCGQPFCPILERIDAQVGFKNKISEHIFGPSQEVFVGSYDYPYVSFGPLAAVDERPVSVRSLYGKPYADIIRLRSSMVRGKKFATENKRMKRDMQEVALGIKATDVEMKFTKKPNMAIQFSSLVQPMGPSAPLFSFRQAENPKIPKKVDQVIEDSLLAADAVAELMEYKFDSYYITNIFSTGALGKEENRKMVPTRWSITALDDIIGKQRMEKIRNFDKQINDYLVFSHKDYDNSYTVLMMPGNWEFENFESWSPKSIWAMGSKETVTTGEYEPFHGRTKYADKQVGGYYASRFSIAEYLEKVRRQARIVVFREIGEGYMVPLGVFQVREGVRTALGKPPKIFNTLQDAFGCLSGKLNVSLNRYLKMSRILRQRRLTDF
jgi:hypothetical protein